MTQPRAESSGHHRQRLRSPATVGLVGAAALAALHLRDPHAEGSWGLCPFLALTGHPCPGCGGLRAINDLTHGDVPAAVSSNALVVVLIVALAAAWVVWVVRAWRGRTGSMIQLGPGTAVVVVLAVITFGIVRNLPFGSWLAP